MNIPEWLSRLAIIDSFLTLCRHRIEVAYVEIPENEISFLEFVLLIVDLFADGQLKRLKMAKRISLNILQTLENLQEGLFTCRTFAKAYSFENSHDTVSS